MSESVHQLHAQEVQEPVELTRLERLATWLSLACAVHCLALPLLALAMPVLGAWSTVLHDPALDRLLLVLVLAAALPSAFWGYRRHRDARVLGGVLAGAVVYALGHVFESHGWYGEVFAVLGALTLAAGSFASARLSHRVVHHHGADCVH